MSRIALGTLQASADPTTMIWALVGYLRRSGQQVQIFHDQARFPDVDHELQICGQNARYLDSWLMSPQLCRQSFVHGGSGSDISLVVGRLQSARPLVPFPGGSLEELCHWLDLPQLAIVDVAQLSDCRLPPRPQGAAGLLLDRVSDDNFFYWQTTLEALWGVPVLAALPELPTARAKIGLVAADAPNACALCHDLAQELAQHIRFPEIMRLALRGNLAPAESSLFGVGDQLAGLTVAVAFDEAINGYFPDVLDVLEFQGATVRDFSLLHDEALPSGTDVVYIGCGHPERYAQQLANNHCMTLALRNHVRQGRRVYAEGGGMAYLCQTLRLPSGEYLPMAGVLPAVAMYAPGDGQPCPAEVTLAHDHWLGSAGSKLRGYVDTNWHLEPAGPLESLIAEPSGHWLLAARGQAVGSRLQLNFAAQPEFVRQFSPARTSLSAS